jgi:nucleotide-binding universal stress UspA family protein
LGSVSVAVLKSAACPVIVCRPAPDGPTDGVVVGADGTEESLPVLEFAFAQASLRELPLTVVHSFWDAVAAVAQHREAGGEVVDQPEFEELKMLLATSIAGFGEKYPDVDVTIQLRHGLTDEALSRPGSAWDLVVVGRHPMTGLRRTLSGSIAASVAERSRAVVAMVPVGD